MTPPPKIGQFRHRPAPLVRSPEGELEPPRRRRFPYRGLVPLAFAVSGPLGCAMVSWLLRAAGLAPLLPTRLSGKPLPPSPGWSNLLFGAGFVEIAFASALAGYWLWSLLWKTRLPRAAHHAGRGTVFTMLLRRGLLLGVGMVFLAQPIAAFGFYLRNAPSAQPWIVRPLFGLLAAIVVPFSELWTFTIPAVLVLLGLLMGASTAAAVTLLWEHFPEEPLPK